MFLRFRKASAIGNLAPGRVAVIEGTVVARRDLALPGDDGLRCVFYELLSESYRTGARGKGRAMWIPDSVERKAMPFFVADATGRIWVLADRMGLTVDGARQVSGRLDKRGRKRFVASFLQDGERVRLRGLVADSRPEVGEPADTAVLGPGPKGRLELLVRGGPESR